MIFSSFWGSSRVYSGSYRSALYNCPTSLHVDYDWMIGLIYRQLSKCEEHLTQKTRLDSSESIKIECVKIEGLDLTF